MKNLCTVSDSEYLLKGLTMYESLLETSKNFVLHYLCIDEKSFNFLKDYQSSNLIVYNCEFLIKNDKQLFLLKQTNYKYFCWSLSAYFTKYLVDKNITNLTDITYIDSDILFHEDIQILYDNFADNDIGIFRHRHFDLNKNYPEGFYNVGVVYFKNSEIGRNVLHWWNDAVQYQKYPHLATCGDQKYLDEFPKLCKNIYIDSNVGHGAPWLWQLYDFSEFEKSGNIIWNGEKQKLCFTHFSQFKMSNDSYIPSLQHHIYTPLNKYDEIKELKSIYNNYFNKMIKTQKKYYG
jgi:hypothetical protein